MKVELLIVATVIVSCSAFGGDDHRFIKKYAMMKVYESCLGPDVLKETRLEMKAASAKCAAMAPPPEAGAATPPPPYKEPAASTAAPQPPAPSRKHGKPQHQSFDPAKLQQAILGFKSQQQWSQSPYQGANAQPLKLYQQQQQQQQSPAAFTPAALYPSQFPQAAYYQAGNSLYSAQPQSYQAPFNPFFQQQTPFFQQQQQSPFYQQQQPLFPQALGYFSQRSSRDLDLRNQLEALTSQDGNRIRNVTCVIQELGYLDENMEPHYAHIVDRISRLPVDDELKKDMVDGVEFCKQFSECVPDIRKDRFPLSRELVRPMFFFKCYKHKKLEACIMKDVREKYSQADDLAGEESVAGAELRSLDGRGKRTGLDDDDVALYDFLYGGDGGDYDTLM